PSCLRLRPRLGDFVQASFERASPWRQPQPEYARGLAAVEPRVRRTPRRRRILRRGDRLEGRHAAAAPGPAGEDRGRKTVPRGLALVGEVVDAAAVTVARRG